MMEEMTKTNRRSRLRRKRKKVVGWRKRIGRDGANGHYSQCFLEQRTLFSLSWRGPVQKMHKINLNRLVVLQYFCLGTSNISPYTHIDAFM